MKLPWSNQKDDVKIEFKKALKEQEEAKRLNPKWLVPTILALMLIGLIWIVVFYITASGTTYGYPIPTIGNWNIAIGLALILAGFILTTIWK